MFDTILNGLLLGSMAGLIYCWLRGIDDNDCGWVLFGGFIALGLIVALLLPQASFAKLHDYILAIFMALFGYRILSHEPRDEYEKNNRFFGWLLIILAAFMAITAIFNL